MRDFARGVPVASHVKDYVGRLILATHSDNSHTIQAVKKYIRYGSSPRGAQSLVLASKILALMRGRYNVSFQDIRDVASAALRHRLILNFEAEAEGIKPDLLVAKLLEAVPEVPNLK
jgi:MoxR-like ATPase